MRKRTCTLLIIVGIGPSLLAAAAPDFSRLERLGQDSLAKADIAGAAAIYGQACHQSADTVLTTDQRASCEHHLAIVDKARGNYALAEERLLKALADWDEAGPTFRPSYAMSLINLGELYRNWHRTPEAEKTLLRAVQLTRDLRDTYPQTYGEALSRLGGLYAESQDPEKGRQLLNEAIPILRTQGEKEAPELAEALDTLGMIDLVAARYKEAQSLISEALRLSIAALGENHPETATHESNLALAYIQDRQVDRAEPLLKKALFALEGHNPVDDSRLWMIYSQSSIVACAQGRFSMAEDYALKAISVLEHTPYPDPRRISLTRVNLGVVYLRSNRLEDADRILAPAVAEERRVAPESTLLADGLRELADLRSIQRDWREAQELYRESLGIYGQRIGSHNVSLLPILKAYTEALKRGGGARAELKSAEAQIKSITTSVNKT